MITKYAPLKLIIIWTLFAKGKLSIRKVYNLMHCYIAYKFKLDKSARTPFVINFDVSNHCNENCVFCRDETGKIFNQNPAVEVDFIPKGTMKAEVFEEIVEQTHKSLLMAIPYVNGEPFVYKRLGRILAYAKQRKVGTMISSNGIQLNEDNINLIIDNDLDQLKVHVSGFTNPVHQIQHRVGDVEVIRANLTLLAKKLRERKQRMIVLIDYIEYKHNQHETELFRNFTEQLGFLFSVRPGNPKGMEQSEDLQPTSIEDASQIACDWLWKVLTVNWNGDVLACCDFVVWSDTHGYGTFIPGETDIVAMWNGPEVVKMRRTHRDQGRKPIPICSECKRTGVEYKY